MNAAQTSPTYHKTTKGSLPLFSRKLHTPEVINQPATIFLDTKQTDE